MSKQTRVLACVDQSNFAEHVTDYAVWAASRLRASLELLHTIDRHPEVARQADRSGAIGIDAQSQLLDTLSSDDEERSRAAREQSRLFLNRLRERAVQAGVVDADMRQRHGSLQETLKEQESAVDLFVLGRRGRSAEMTQRDLGRNVESVVRLLRRPILAVTDSFREPSRVLFAFDGSAVTRRGIETLANSSLLRGLPIHVLMSGKPRADADKQLRWAQGLLERSGFAVSTEFAPGDAESVIALAVKERDIDLLAMGAYSHSPLRSLLLGSKTSDLLRSARIPVLLLR